MLTGQNEFANKVIWITGASSGLGEQLAYAFAAKGATLILSARREHELMRIKERIKEISSHSFGVYVLPMDLSQPETIPAKFKHALDAMGSIDILVNNAGISQRSLAVETDTSVYRTIMEVNFFGPLQLSQLMLQQFKTQNTGLFVVISSVTGKIGLPYRSAYTAAKHAVEGYFGSLRTEIWRSGIRVLTVRPGAIKTAIAENALTGNGSRYNQGDPIITRGQSAETSAKLILQAISRNRSNLIIGSIKEKLLFLLIRLAPRMAFNAVKKIKLEK